VFFDIETINNQWLVANVEIVNVFFIDSLYIYSLVDIDLNLSIKRFYVFYMKKRIKFDIH
jgi:hypothetical protein